MQKLHFPEQLNQSQVDSGSRLLVYQREYLVFEKSFPDHEGLHDWLAINTLLPQPAIDILCARGQIICGEGIHQEFLQLEHKPTLNENHETLSLLTSPPTA